MLTIDDGAILKRAKELCERSGLAWNLLSKTSRDMRVLTDRDRRECLMRSRDELMRAAEEESFRQSPGPIAKDTTEAQGGKTEQLASPPDERLTAAPARRVA